MLGSRWAQKPPVGTAIDWGAPLSRGLMGLYALNEGTGNTICDAARNLDLACNGFGSLNPWGVGPSGAGLVTSGAGTAGAQATIPAPLQLGYPLSIACGVRILGTTSNSGRIFGLMPVNTVTPPYATAVFYAASSTSVGADFQWGGSGFLTPTVTISQGVDYVLGLTVTPTSYAFYVNGSVAASGTGSLGTPIWTAHAQLLAGGWTSVSGNPACKPLYWGAWWSRAIDPGEHAEIGRDVNAIWRIFRRQEWARTGLAAARLSYPRAASVLRPVQLPTTDLTCYLD